LSQGRGSVGRAEHREAPQRQFNLALTDLRWTKSEHCAVHDGQPRTVVTGGAGFVGSHLVDALLEEENGQVVVLDNLSRGRMANLAGHDADPRLRMIHGDVRDLAAVREACAGADVVFHLAAQSTVMGGARDIDYTFSSNVIGTYNVLKIAAEEGARRLVFASSREVYGEPVGVPVEESHPLLAINSYGASKVAGEALCRAFAKEANLPCVILRLANVYGPRDVGRVIPHWIEEARDGRELVVYGGRQVIDFIWVGDVVQAILRAAALETALPPINVASGTGTKIADLARRISRLAESPAQTRIVPPRSIEVMRFIGATDRMKELLGLAPAADPLSHLPEMVHSMATAAA